MYLEHKSKYDVEFQSDKPVEVQLNLPFRLSPNIQKGIEKIQENIQHVEEENNVAPYPSIYIDVKNVGPGSFDLVVDGLYFLNDVDPSHLALPYGPITFGKIISEGGITYDAKSLPVVPQFALFIPETEDLLEVTMMTRHEGRERTFRSVPEKGGVDWMTNGERQLDEFLYLRWAEITTKGEEYKVVQFPQTKEAFDNTQFVFSRMPKSESDRYST